MTTLPYVGSELDIFAKAAHWKAYWRSHILPFMKGDVLEVGAGIGANTSSFVTDAFKSWTCLEPDVALCAQLRARVEDSATVRVLAGTIADLPPTGEFDSILYIDVLEHIADDRAELNRATLRLRRGGSLIVLSPAYQWLYTPFDQAIGHFRRYTARSLAAAAPFTAKLISMRYLDTAGMLASLGNRFLLKQANPSESQILFWDSYIIPVSRLVDRAVRYRFGKTIVGIWRRE